VRRAPALLAALLAAAAPLAAHEGPHDGAPAAEPRADANRLYEPPAPGSYELPPFDRVSEHRLLAIDGSPATLPGLAPGQVAVVSFIYRSCSDASGCPLALSVLRRLDRMLTADAALAGRVRLATVTFDLARDTPARMGELRASMAPRGDWSFLVPAGEADLATLLDDYGQDAVAIRPDGAQSIGHVLKVFLVDSERRIRNVYSSGFLDPELVRNDILTVMGPS
jgi:cytochrome c peroxidase